MNVSARSPEVTPSKPTYKRPLHLSVMKRNPSSATSVTPSIPSSTMLVYTDLRTSEEAHHPMAPEELLVPVQAPHQQHVVPVLTGGEHLLRPPAAHDDVQGA